ncbi:MAG: FxsA family protein [Pontiella sp.]|nr:FxsA family protein [Pontiella sp.]MBT8046312.1 FxsA family protein [Pontiella sp.]NNJ70204.1 FxsA family protein [Kiritimatiellales bacterium]
MPLSYLIALFIGMPILELALLIRLHGAVGFLPTILLVFLTGVAGAALVRHQGISALLKIQREMAAGNLPAPQIIDGVMILLAGALLITPGLVTDVVGFALLVPYVRERIRFWLRKKLEQKMQSGYIEVHVNRP